MSAFTCPCCGAVSPNPNDIAQRYCGRCHDWTGDPGLGLRHLARDCPHRTEGRTLTDLTALPWRQGRHQGRHLYAQLGPEPSDDDPLVGTLDTAELAAEACEAHNAALARRIAGQ